MDRAATRLSLLHGAGNSLWFYEITPEARLNVMATYAADMQPTAPVAPPPKGKATVGPLIPGVRVASDAAHDFWFGGP